MPDAITTAQVIQFQSNIELQLQQQQSLLGDKVTVGNYHGKKASIVEQFGSADAVELTGRHSDTPLLDLSQDRRWVFPSNWAWGSMVDDMDRLRINIEPTGAYTLAAAASLNRKQDDILITAMFDTAYTGEDGTTSETFGTVGSGDYDVATTVGGSNALLNVAKLKKVIQLAMLYNKGELTEPLYGAISSYEHDSLLNQAQVINKEYNNAMVMENGLVKRLLGINFTITERLNITSGNRLLPFWVKSGMHLGLWEGLYTNISERSDKNYSTQVYARRVLGATRTQLGKVFRVNVDDQI